MYSFKSDYSEGAHPKVLEALIQTNLEQTVGYGEDDYCNQARRIIKQKVNNENVDVHFLVGGTQANLTVISASLRPYQAVIACDTGHINVHETGAIEATGHKVLVAPSLDGKLTKELIDPIVKAHGDEHMVQPKMVYISNPTELGTVYSKEELKDLYDYCKQRHFYLYIDGARLANALALEKPKVSWQDLAAYSDVFYIGGTKCGALFGEAVVIVNDELKKDFRYMIKQRGGMLAKGRLLGLQFKTLLENDLYEQIGKYQNKMADQMRQVFIEHGLTFLSDSPTNQLFPILKNEVIEKLGHDFDYTFYEQLDDDHACIRLVTSFATTKESIDAFKKIMEKIL